MPQSYVAKAVLFSDIVGSSKLYLKLGGQQAEESINTMLKSLEFCTQNHTGEVIKTIGDEIMCAFPSVKEAFECAAEMNIKANDSGMQLRTSISFGRLITRNKDLFGDAVNNAAFLTRKAKPNEVLVDQSAFNTGQIDSLDRIELVAEMVFKGQNKPRNVYRLNWEKTENIDLGATLIGGENISTTRLNKTLVLRYQNQMFLINCDRPIFNIGRSVTDCELGINHVRISRQHCTIELKQGKFRFVDHSTNGSYIYHGSNQATSIHRESFVLVGQGKIRLGQDEENDVCTIYYDMK